MALRPKAKSWTIREQIVEDDPSGLTFQFEIDEKGRPCLYVYGDLPLGNREILFAHDGEEAAAGTSLRGLCRATWITEVGS